MARTWYDQLKEIDAKGRRPEEHLTEGRTHGSLERFDDAGSIGGLIERSIAAASDKIGTVNVLIAGRTGVGKSTLINEIFQGELAKTGQGEPVTQETRRLTKKGLPLAIYDTRGLEMKEYRQIIDELANYVKSKSGQTDINQHIHVAWVCLSEDGRRVEQAEIDLHKRLAGSVPVLGVITKARADQGFKAVVRRLLPEATNVVRVRALRERLDDGHVTEPMGLKDLVEATAECIPEAAQRAFAATQKASIDLKKKAAHKVVVGATAAAVAAGATPIPFSDAAVLAPVQIGMLAGISATFGIELSKAFLGTLVSAAVGVTGATFLGRAIVANLLKFIPGVGSVAGGIISAGTAGALTTALGTAYIAALAKLFVASEGDPPSSEEIAREFRKRMSKRA